MDFRFLVVKCIFALTVLALYRLINRFSAFIHYFYLLIFKWYHRTVV